MASSTRASTAIGVPAFETTWPLTVTCPARISARARSREGARPRSTSSDIQTRLALRHAESPRRTPSRTVHAGWLPLTRDDSVFPRHDPVGDRAEVPFDEPCILTSTSRARVGAFGGQLPGARHAEQRGVGRLRARRVFAGGLSQLLRAAFDVEDVVDDLKRQPDLGAVPIDGRDERLRPRRP